MFRLPLILASLLAILTASAAAADPFAGDEPSLKASSPTIVKTKALVWLAGQGANAETQAAAKKLWEAEVRPDQLLDRYVETIALGDERAAALVALAAKRSEEVELPDVAWLKDKRLDAPVGENLRLYYGRWLARNRLYDEALQQLADLKPEEVVDPASLLFFQGVCCHSLLKKKPGLAAIKRLLEDVQDAPDRYLAVAALMQQDLGQLQGDSLDYASRLMNDVERRLALGRAGRRVRKVEDDVVAVLDRLIEELEKQGGT